MNLKISISIPICLLLYSCGPSISYIDARAAYTDCELRNESIIKVDQCARSTLRNHEQQYGGGTVRNYDTETLKVYRGLVHKVKTKQLSNSVAQRRFQNYTRNKTAANEAASRESARKVGEASRGLDELFSQPGGLYDILNKR
jgi:hypothetical protein